MLSNNDSNWPAPFPGMFDNTAVTIKPGNNNLEQLLGIAVKWSPGTCPVPVEQVESRDRRPLEESRGHLSYKIIHSLLLTSPLPLQLSHNWSLLKTF